MKFDVVLVGSTGQIGRALFKELQTFGYTVYAAGRGDMNLPSEASHVINAAGFTVFDRKSAIDKYWNDNVMLATKLAEYAVRIDARYHQLSSHGVAEFSPLPLTYHDRATIRSRMKTYTISKVLTEWAVESVVPREQLSIYRVSDVVPDFNTIDRDWRRNHWLSVLFSAGRHFIEDDNYPVWIAEVDDLARALTYSLQHSPGTHHLLGRIYRWSDFYAAAANLPVTPKMMRLVGMVLPHVRIRPPLAESIIEGPLHHHHDWKELDAGYWNEFAYKSAKEAKSASSSRSVDPSHQA